VQCSLLISVHCRQLLYKLLFGATAHVVTGLVLRLEHTLCTSWFVVGSGVYSAAHSTT
jgi:uncharacterized membrane protein YjjB (DUF3815 family)